MYNNKIINKAYEIINEKKARSAWERGVREYAAEDYDKWFEEV